jgi:gamma-glutamyltranspeptidase / glutathione hydrolase
VPGTVNLVIFRLLTYIKCQQPFSFSFLVYLYKSCHNISDIGSEGDDMECSRPLIHSRKGVVAAGHYLATTAGLKMFARGGNAVDAAVAAGFALAVLKPHQNTLGGECPILIYSPQEKKVLAISGQGTAPGKATIAWFREKGIRHIPGDGLLGAVVPGMFGAYCTALEKYGRLTLQDVLEPALELAEKGFPMYRALRNTIMRLEGKFSSEWPTSKEVFLPNGKVPGIGEVFRQPALAATFRRLMQAEKGACAASREDGIIRAAEYFYKGEIARELVDFGKRNAYRDGTGEYHSSLLEMDDFSNYETVIEEPECADYRNYRVYKCGPWTQGPVFLQQLKLLEGFDLKKMGHNTFHYIHTVIECSKLAFEDRDKYYGDPGFCSVPLKRLLSGEYNDKRRESVSMDNTYVRNVKYAEAVSGENSHMGDTTHLDVIDDTGLMISATPSGAWIPSSPVVPNLGFPLGIRAQVFNLVEGHPNCLQPGKRPRTTLTPSIAFKDGKPWMAFGTPGGDMQDQWTLQFFLNVAEFGMNLQEAVEQPSFHTANFENSFHPHNLEDEKIYVEEGIKLDDIYRLQELGHGIRLDKANTHGEVCAVAVNHDTGMLEGAASIKAEGNAYVAGW